MKEQVKNILIPVDFTNASKNAVRYVTKIFKDEPIQLTLLYVTPGLSDPEIIEKDFEQLKKLEIPGSTFSISHTVVQGDPQMEILRASRGNADLVVLGIKKPEQVLHSSIADALLKNFDCPVITVPENYVAYKIRRITYASDHKLIEQSEVFDNMRYFAQKFDSKIYIFHLYPDHETHVKDNTEPVLEYYLESTDHEYYTIVEPDMVSAIQEFVENNHIDLLTVLTRDHGNNVLTSEGRLVYELVKTSGIPMLILN